MLNLVNIWQQFSFNDVSYHITHPLTCVLYSAIRFLLSRYPWWSSSELWESKRLINSLPLISRLSTLELVKIESRLCQSSITSAVSPAVSIFFGPVDEWILIKSPSLSSCSHTILNGYRILSDILAMGQESLFESTMFIPVVQWVLPCELELEFLPVHPRNRYADKVHGVYLAEYRSIHRSDGVPMFDNSRLPSAFSLFLTVVINDVEELDKNSFDLIPIEDLISTSDKCVITWIIASGRYMVIASRVITVLYQGLFNWIC